jgi:hypothetical protein
MVHQSVLDAIRRYDEEEEERSRRAKLFPTRDTIAQKLAELEEEERAAQEVQAHEEVVRQDPRMGVQEWQQSLIAQDPAAQGAIDEARKHEFVRRTEETLEPEIVEGLRRGAKEQGTEEFVEKQLAQEKTIDWETEPWIDPVVAATGPMGMARKLGATAVTKAVIANLATELPVGLLQDEFAQSWKGMGKWEQFGLNALTGMVTGTLFSKGFDKTADLIEVGIDAGAKIRADRKVKGLKGAMGELYGQGKGAEAAPPPQTRVSPDDFYSPENVNRRYGERIPIESPDRLDAQIKEAMAPKPVSKHEPPLPPPEKIADDWYTQEAVNRRFNERIKPTEFPDELGGLETGIVGGKPKATKYKGGEVPKAESGFRNSRIASVPETTKTNLPDIDPSKPPEGLDIKWLDERIAKLGSMEAVAREYPAEVGIDRYIRARAEATFKGTFRAGEEFSGFDLVQRSDGKWGIRAGGDLEFQGMKGGEPVWGKGSPRVYANEKEAQKAIGRIAKARGDKSIPETRKFPWKDPDTDLKNVGPREGQDMTVKDWEDFQNTKSPEPTPQEDAYQKMIEDRRKDFQPSKEDMEALERGEIFPTRLEEDPEWIRYRKEALAEAYEYTVQSSPIHQAAIDFRKAGIDPKHLKRLGYSKDEIFELNRRHPGTIRKGGTVELDSDIRQYGFTDLEEFMEAYKGAVRKQDITGETPAKRAKKGKKEEAFTEDPLEADGTTTLYSTPFHYLAKKFTQLYGKYVADTKSWDKLVNERFPIFIEKQGAWGSKAARAAFNDFRGVDFDNPDAFNKALKQMRTNQGIGGAYGVALGKRLQSLPEADQLWIGDYLRGEIDGKSAFGVRAPAHLQELAEETRDILYHLGKMATQYGLLDPEVFFKNIGKYMPRLYTSKEYTALVSKYNITPPTGMQLHRFKKKMDIPKEVREAMGEILTPGYPVAKGIAQITHDIEFQKFYRTLLDNPKWAINNRVLETGDNTFAVWKGNKAVAEFSSSKEAHAFAKQLDQDIPEHFVELSGKKFGDLNGAKVHPEIAAELQSKFKERNETWMKALSAWKFGKVVMSPKTHVRNFFSNSALSFLGGMGFVDQAVYMRKALPHLRDGGEFYDLAMQTGLLKSDFINAEIRDMYGAIEAALPGTRAGSFAEHFGELGQGVAGAVKKGMNKASDLYQGSEHWYKMARFMWNIEKRGMGAQEAADDAAKWLFDYGDISRLNREWKSSWWGSPFATFTFKAAPRILESAVTAPWRLGLLGSSLYMVTNYAANAVFGEDKEEADAKRKFLPEWMGNFVNWPRVAFKDDHGRDYYLNLEFWTPWGDLFEGGGMIPFLPGGLQPFTMPFLKEIIEQGAGDRGFDMFFKDEIVRKEDLAGKDWKGRAWQHTKDRGVHAWNHIAPTIAIDIEKTIQAARGKPDSKGRERPLGVVLADMLLGLKMYPVSYTDELVKRISKSNPEASADAQRIQQLIVNAATQRNAFLKKGRSVSRFDAEIAARTSQLVGMSGEMGKVAEEAGEAGILKGQGGESSLGAGSGGLGAGGGGLGAGGASGLGAGGGGLGASGGLSNIGQGRGMGGLFSQKKKAQQPSRIYDPNAL